MREIFQQVAGAFREARAAPLAAHPLAQFIRRDAVDAVVKALGPLGTALTVTGSPGQGNWAEIPWIAVFDPVVTESATRGHYIVYLFSSDMRRLYLSLNQGTTIVRNEFGRDTRDELMRRSAIMRSRISEFSELFTSEPIDLAAAGTLARDYEAGHALGTMYHLHDLPFSQVLIDDLQNLTRLYFKLTARGGFEASEGHERASEEAGLKTITEQRRYTFHRRIERDSSAGREAKKVHGYICQVCGFDFETVYGPIGRNFIEAHHLTPISELPEDTPVEQNPTTDFAVLCANCHRMIHKMPDARNIRALLEAGNLSDLVLLHARLRKS